MGFRVFADRAECTQGAKTAETEPSESKNYLVTVSSSSLDWTRGEAFEFENCLQRVRRFIGRLRTKVPSGTRHFSGFRGWNEARRNLNSEVRSSRPRRGNLTDSIDRVHVLPAEYRLRYESLSMDCEFFCLLCRKFLHLCTRHSVYNVILFNCVCRKYTKLEQTPAVCNILEFSEFSFLSGTTFENFTYD